jgi:hypothetical protein
MHLTDFVQFDKLIGDLAYLPACHFDQYVSEAHAQLLGSRRALAWALGSRRALAWAQDLANLVQVKAAELGQQHQQHQQRHEKYDAERQQAREGLLYLSPLPLARCLYFFSACTPFPRRIAPETAGHFA